MEGEVEDLQLVYLFPWLEWLVGSQRIHIFHIFICHLNFIFEMYLIISFFHLTGFLDLLVFNSLVLYVFWVLIFCWMCS